VPSYNKLRSTPKLDCVT